MARAEKRGVLRALARFSMTSMLIDLKSRYRMAKWRRSMAGVVRGVDESKAVRASKMLSA